MVVLFARLKTPSIIADFVVSKMDVFGSVHRNNV